MTASIERLSGARTAIIAASFRHGNDDDELVRWSSFCYPYRPSEHQSREILTSPVPVVRPQIVCHNGRYDTETDPMRRGFGRFEASKSQNFVCHKSLEARMP